MLEGLATNRFLREGSAKADLGAETAVLEHDTQLAALGRLLAQRGWIYVRFLSELAKLFVRIARAVESLHHEALQGDAPPFTPPDAGESVCSSQFPLPTYDNAGTKVTPQPLLSSSVMGPFGLPAGNGPSASVPTSGPFRQSLHIAPRPRGEQGTA